MRSPSRLRTAGSSVSAATTETMPTRIAPVARLRMIVFGTSSEADHREHERGAAEEHGAARRRAGRDDRVDLLAPLRALLAEAARMKSE